MRRTIALAAALVGVLGTTIGASSAAPNCYQFRGQKTATTADDVSACTVDGWIHHGMAPVAISGLGVFAGDTAIIGTRFNRTPPDTGPPGSVPGVAVLALEATSIEGATKGVVDNLNLHLYHPGTSAGAPAKPLRVTVYDNGVKLFDTKITPVRTGFAPLVVACSRFTGLWDLMKARGVPNLATTEHRWWILLSAPAAADSQIVLWDSFDAASRIDFNRPGSGAGCATKAVG